MRHLKIALLALVALYAPVQAQDRPSHRVDVEIMDDDRVIARPSIIVTEGGDADVSVQGDAGYRVEVAVDTQPGAPEILMLKARLMQPDRNDWRLVSAPMITFRRGETASIEVAMAEWDKITLSVRPSTEP